jgi:hypothetical protein
MKTMQFIMGNGKKMVIEGMEEVYRYGPMVADMKDIGLKIKQIKKEN